MSEFALYQWADCSRPSAQFAGVSATKDPEEDRGATSLTKKDEKREGEGEGERE